MVVNREDGPVLVEGPVEVTTGDGEVFVSERFVVAVCTCRRSRTYPWCDTSHRQRAPATPDSTAAGSRTPGAAARTGEPHTGTAPTTTAEDSAS